MKSGGESIIWALAFEFAPAVIFGAAVGFATAIWTGLPLFDVTPVASGGAAFGAAWLGLYTFGSRGRAFQLSEFEEPQVEFERSPVGELLDEADIVGIVERLGAALPRETNSKPEELELDDVLPTIEPESRVVQLFQSTDTAGEMQARIDRHLRAPRQAPPDATQELHDALAALRRSLR
jgi:hypothetical protein